MLSLYLKNIVLSQSQSPSFYLQRLLMRPIVAFVADFTDMMVREDWRCSGSEEHNSNPASLLLGPGIGNRRAAGIRTHDPLAPPPINIVYTVFWS